MKKTSYTPFSLVVFALVFLCGAPSISHAAASTSATLSIFEGKNVTVTNQYDETYTYVDETPLVDIAEGDVFQMDPAKSYTMHVYVDDFPADYTPHGELYFVPDISSNTGRQFVADLGPYNGQLFSFSQLGTYEIDVYQHYNPPPILIKRSIFDNDFFNFFIIPIAHAQSPDIFIETIHFKVTDAMAPAECCSDVLFIPGIKGSVLKKKALVGDDMLWPPSSLSNDVEQIGLNADGSSKEDVFVDGIVNDYSVGPFSVPVYHPFSLFMDDLVASGTISHWESLPYDWRFMPEDILANGIKTKEGVVDVVEKIETLAAHSPTGKVTIVAHSMGGLMGKAIIKKLQDEGKDDLIDSYVMVGSPQLGTPQTIGSLLHGDNEGIPGGALSFLNSLSVKPEDARILGQNMPSAYNLLPAEKYFEAVDDPVLVFDENSTFTELWRGFWGTAVDSYADLAAFMTGQGITREKPAVDDLASPEVVNAGLIQKAKVFHEMFDTYVFPAHINVVEVAGWGRPTVKGIKYTTEHDQLSYEPIFTIEGDKVVVYPSALSSGADSDYFFNLDSYLDTSGKPVTHKDLLSINSIQKVISSVVKKEIIDNPELVTTSKPNISDTDDQLIVSVHSPVVLGVHDAAGNFTGIDNATGEVIEDIPGSSVSIFANSEYIFVPKDGDYTFMYKGTDNGSTTIKIESFVQDVTTPIVTYSDLPTTPKTSAQFQVIGSTPENTEIQVDKDGDGVADTHIKADGVEQSLEELLDELKASMRALSIEQKVQKRLLAKAKVLENLFKIRNQKIQKIAVAVQIGITELEIRGLRRTNNISQEDAQGIIELLTNIKEKI